MYMIYGNISYVIFFLDSGTCYVAQADIDTFLSTSISIY